MQSCIKQISKQDVNSTKISNEECKFFENMAEFLNTQFCLLQHNKAYLIELILSKNVIPRTQ